MGVYRERSGVVMQGDFRGVFSRELISSEAEQLLIGLERFPPFKVSIKSLDFRLNKPDF